jgi:O-methyltransferase domain
VSAVAKAADMPDRLTAEAGDFFERVPAGFDTYLMSMVLHDWDDERAIRLLRNIATAGEPGARVRALELVVPAGISRTWRR